MLRRKSFADIGGFDGGWLKAKYHFAMGPYGNPAHKPVGNLIVVNDDEIAPNSGFGLHPHENVEIVNRAVLFPLSKPRITGRSPGTAPEVRTGASPTGSRHARSVTAHISAPVRTLELDDANP